MIKHINLINTGGKIVLAEKGSINSLTMQLHCIQNGFKVFFIPHFCQRGMELLRTQLRIQLAEFFLILESKHKQNKIRN